LQEFEKQDVVNELQMKSLSKKLSEASKAFDQKPVAIIKNSELTGDQSKVLECLKSNNGTGLNCRAEVLDFVTFVENNTYPVATN